MDASPQDKVWSNWFEIPTTDIKRAQQFYQDLFQVDIQLNDFGNFKMGIFPHTNVGCALVQGKEYTPGSQGPLVYMNCEPDLTPYLKRVKKAGGKVLREKTRISEQHGHMALIIDSEGNRMALWSQN